MSDVLAELGWPGPRLGEAMEALGRWAGLGGRTAGEAVPPTHDLAEGGERLDRWVEAGADRLGRRRRPGRQPHRPAPP